MFLFQAGITELWYEPFTVLILGSFHWRKREHMTLFCHLATHPAVVLTIVPQRSSCYMLLWLNFFCLTSPLVSRSLSQAHGSGGPEELHLLAESERRCHCVCRAGLRHVQSTSQTAVIRTACDSLLPPQVPLLTLPPFPLPTWKTQKRNWLTNQPGPQLHFIPLPTMQHGQETNHRYILYAFMKSVV